MKTLLKFEADWCGPCQQIKPLVDEVLNQKNGVSLQTVNIDNPENQALVAKHAVRAIPTLVLLDEVENVVATHRGSLNRGQLEAFVSQ